MKCLPHQAEFCRFKFHVRQDERDQLFKEIITNRQWESSLNQFKTLMCASELRQ